MSTYMFVKKYDGQEWWQQKFSNRILIYGKLKSRFPFLLIILFEHWHSRYTLNITITA